MTTDSSQTSSLFCAAVVASAHGVHGHVKIKCFLEDPTHFKDYSPFLNERGEGSYKVKKILSQDKDILIVSFEGIIDRNAAEQLRGTKLMAPIGHLPKLPEETFYHRDLIGLSVLSSHGESFGKVHALYNFGAGELLEVKTSKEDLQMIPFTKILVPEINLKEGILLLSKEGERLLKRGNNGA